MDKMKCVMMTGRQSGKLVYQLKSIVERYQKENIWKGIDIQIQSYDVDKLRTALKDISETSTDYFEYEMESVLHGVIDKAINALK